MLLRSLGASTQELLDSVLLLQFGYESGWLGWDVLVLTAFCVVCLLLSLIPASNNHSAELCPSSACIERTDLHMIFYWFFLPK